MGTRLLNTAAIKGHPPCIPMLPASDWTPPLQTWETRLLEAVQRVMGQVKASFGVEYKTALF
eukprot:2864667-Pyramimonas_sp.AAC.1